MLLPLLILAAAIIAIGIWPGVASWLTEAAGAAVMGN
jgi:hypothetical protein